MRSSIVEAGAILATVLSEKRPIKRKVRAPSDLAKHKERTLAFLNVLSLVGGNTALQSALLCHRVKCSRIRDGRLAWPSGYDYTKLRQDFGALQKAVAAFDNNCRRDLEDRSISSALAAELSRVVKEWRAIAEKYPTQQPTPASRA